MFKQTISAVAVLGVAGLAQAVPQVQITSESWNWFTDVDAGFNQGPPRTGVGGDNAQILSNPGTYGGDFAVAAVDLGPNVNAVSAGVNFTTEFDENSGFSIRSTGHALIDMESTFDANGPTLFEDFSEARTQLGGNFSVTLTEDATVRLRIDGFVNESAIGDSSAHRVRLTGAPTLPLFEVGTEDSATSGVPFDQTIELVAGVYSFEFSDAHSGRNVEFVDGFSRESELNFSFEIIPAPGAVSLFGLAGLTAARRRR